MSKVYKSKVDIWLVIVILGFYLIPTAPFMYSDFSLVGFCIVISVCVFTMALLYSTKYIIDEKRLIVKSAFVFSEEFCIDDIQSIKSTKSILSAPAASLDRMELNFRNTSIIISPKDKAGFINSIKEVCSHEIDISI